MACSQHDGYHVGSTFQGFVDCGKLVECKDVIQLASKYDAKVVIPLLMVCFEPQYHCICYNNWWCEIGTWRKYAWNGDLNWKIFSSISHWKVVFVQEAIYFFIHMRKSTNLVVYAWRQIFKCGFSCKIDSWNLEFTKRI